MWRMPLPRSFNIFRRSNKYIDETTPWVLAKDEAKKGRLETVLYNLAGRITIGASLLESFMPDTSAKILEQLHTENAVWSRWISLDFTHVEIM